MSIIPNIVGYFIVSSLVNVTNSTILLKKTEIVGLHKHSPLSENFDSILGTYKTQKGAMGECIHALTIQQCNPIVLNVHLGIKVLKYDHSYQKHTVYLPYFMLHLHVGLLLLVPSPPPYDSR